MNMIEPTEEGRYTTVFKDGSIVHENYWFYTADDHEGKWYWNESIRGGVIHWFKPEVEYELHSWYHLPDWELQELVMAEKKYEAYEKYFNKEDTNKAELEYLINNNFYSYQAFADYEIKNYYSGYKCKE